jgi:aromatic ring-opening dioxygenase catalytic subunit (LigB family)
VGSGRSLYVVTVAQELEALKSDKGTYNKLEIQFPDRTLRVVQMVPRVGACEVAHPARMGAALY